MVTRRQQSSGTADLTKLTNRDVEQMGAASLICKASLIALVSNARNAAMSQSVDSGVTLRLGASTR